MGISTFATYMISTGFPGTFLFWAGTLVTQMTQMTLYTQMTQMTQFTQGLRE